MKKLSEMLDQYQAGERGLPTYAELRTMCAPASGSIIDDPEFQRFGVQLLLVWSNKEWLATFNELARYIDAKLRGTK